MVQIRLVEPYRGANGVIPADFFNSSNESREVSKLSEDQTPQPPPPEPAPPVDSYEAFGLTTPEMDYFEKGASAEGIETRDGK
jgi:hypothetical protein